MRTAARQALFDITGPTNNRNGTQSSPLYPPSDDTNQDASPTTFPRELKRRKLLHISGGNHSRKNSSFHNTGSTQASSQQEEEYPDIPSSPCERVVRYISIREEDEEPHKAVAPLQRIIPLEHRGVGGERLQVAQGSVRSSRLHLSYPINDWQDETSHYYSRPEDAQMCMDGNGLDRCIPFCAASCNTNSLVAIGDENGRVRLLESADGGKPEFANTFLAFRVHRNAIIDMSFTEDDKLLATGSGDQTARVVDMSTQVTLAILANHSASLKQVRFQPGQANNSVLATSSRDGSVRLWDLRCKGADGPAYSFQVPVDDRDHPQTTKVNYGYPVGSIYDAHHNLRPLPPHDPSPRPYLSPRAGDVSVTALSFLPQGQEHLLLTASEANASVKLWDIRSMSNSRRRPVGPLSCTRQPESHSQFRHFGINSLNLSGDGSRVYTLCKDNTVYAYSTAHLILGRAPELSSKTQERPRPQREVQEGLGPLYGIRHPQLHATSFYVKSTLRKAKDGNCEMLAVGSSDGCAILFPTDERYLKQKNKTQDQAENNLDRSRLLPPRQGSRAAPQMNGGGGRRGDDTIPIYQNGTPLVRGHVREVGPVCWSSEGNLITVGDDFLVRCWRQGDAARDLRVGGEQGGRRWACGWATVDASYDDDDE
ncbi:WD domain-containing protein [Phlyctema vagabunda]|uniref:WD domain-containing protein n=1 Tax=Phlyctema vagabunda TaxID=108571 RepID=A0ABR4PK87_9HELO